ncbi:MAG: cadherin-like domain-containing protein, partial [Flavobacteriaceae bacterium]
MLAAENADGSIDLPNGTLTVEADFATTGNYVFLPNQDFNGTETFTYTVTDSESGERATQTVTLTVTPALEENEITVTAISDDNGTSSTDFLTNDTQLTVQGTLANALASDEQLQISVDGGETWVRVSDVSTVDGVTSWNFIDPAIHESDFTYQLRIYGAGDQVGAEASQMVTIDTKEPVVES